MKLPKWLSVLKQVGPTILLIAGVPPTIIGVVTESIESAEKITGAKGKDKLAAVVKAADDMADAMNAVKPGTVNKTELHNVLVSGISTTILTVNALTKEAKPKPVSDATGHVDDSD